MKLISSLVVLLIPTAANASDWVLAKKSNEEIAYVDRQSIKRGNPGSTAWIKVKWYASGSALSHVEINCEESTFRILWGMKKDQKGKILKVNSEQDYEGIGFQSVPPDTVIDKVRTMICE